MGNPPFVGARWMDKRQKEDVLYTFGKDWQGVGDLDYVCCWYKKATELLIGRNTKCAFVSTNSITQGGSVTNLWKPLFSNGLHIDFAWRTFKWMNETSDKSNMAAVHCVIVGFSIAESAKPRVIYQNDQQEIIANNINGYLLDAPNIFIEKRMSPLCDVPQICLGGQPIDDGNLTLIEEEKEALLKKEPQAEQFIRHYMMGKDFIDRRPRYCIWLVGANPTELRKCHEIMRRVENVRKFRLASKRSSTLRAAEMPTLFGAPFECESDYIAIPKVSSENRSYVPIDYLPKEIIPGDKLFVMQRVSIYHFGILTSNVHMAWMRAVCGRLKSDYSYSNTIVYNNFPWPTPSEKQTKKIEQTAQDILDVRAKYPNSSLADLYDKTAMPPELFKAHQANDRAVMDAYGFNPKMTETQIVAELFKMYKNLTEKR
ncbi:MAG: class I SAM-dependent DNA methyltransferase [Alphaproteobacteria bacterium]|nr:class I SAM-dependent DNA methyltransferase [Alphaproteobacteria bacterium]